MVLLNLEFYFKSQVERLELLATQLGDFESLMPCCYSYFDLHVTLYPKKFLFLSGIIISLANMVFE